MKLHECLVRSARRGMELQGENGAMPAGHNGPYLDKETPVRNTGHWLIAFLKAYEISGEKTFLNSAEKALRFLLSKEARPMGKTFWHRENPEKDFANGLIGQAWSIEALSAASEHIDMDEPAKTAKDVFLMHPFNEETGLWKRVNVDGSYLSADGTFNHQLWFAASATLLSRHCKNREILRPVEIFMEKMPLNLDLYPSGLIVHNVKKHSLTGKAKRSLKMWIGRDKRGEIILKAAGYHQFNLYAFALLKTCFPQHPFWKSSLFKKLWTYANSERYIMDIDKSIYGYPYNPPGFEMPFALEIFGDEMQDKREKQEKWLSEQMRRCFDFTSHLMEKNTKDPDTSAARIYEATRLPDLEIKI